MKVFYSSILTYILDMIVTGACRIFRTITRTFFSHYTYVNIRVKI